MRLALRGFKILKNIQQTKMICFNTNQSPEESELENVLSEDNSNKPNSRFSRYAGLIGKSLLGAAAGAAIGAVGASAIHSVAYSNGGNITPESADMIKFAYVSLIGGGALMGIPYIHMGDNK